MPRNVDQLLEDARRRLHRLSPTEAAAVLAGGGLVVDIRPVEQRHRDGEIPGTVVIDRNVLEWRLDPSSPHHIPEVSNHDQPIVLLCNEGFASSLAAATLQDLGLTHATDVDGGFVQWKADGLPVEVG